MKLRIDELAARTGTTSRNIRNYQARGLLPPPELEGRTGYYGEEHLQRLRIVEDLQQRGFSLAAIRQVLDAWAKGGDLSHVIGFHHVLTAPWTDEQPARYTADELFERFPEARERPDLVTAAVEADLIVPVGDGDVFEAPSPMLIQAGEVLVQAGVPLERVLETVEQVRAAVADIAGTLIDLVGEHVVLPATEGSPEAPDVEAVVETLRRLRPVALEVVRPFLARELSRAIGRAVEEAGIRLDDSAVDEAS